MNQLQILLIVTVPLLAHAQGATLIGTLEEPQCRDGGGTFVRALYVKSGGQWRALDSA